MDVIARLQTFAKKIDFFLRSGYYFLFKKSAFYCFCSETKNNYLKTLRISNIAVAGIGSCGCIESCLNFGD